MINEFHSALLNQRFEVNAPGTDFIDNSWEPRELSTNARAIQNALLVNPPSLSACNWRSAELRKLLTRSDLADYRVFFDKRTGYRLDDLIADMTQYFRYRITGTDKLQSIVFDKPLSGPSYELYRWEINVSGNDWSISSPKTTPFAGNVNGATSITSIMPSTDIHITFPSDTDLSFTVTWASRPSTTIADTASHITTGLSHHVNALASEPSTLTQDVINVLLRTAIGKTEPPAQVLAATILLVGNILASPKAV